MNASTLLIDAYDLIGALEYYEHESQYFLDLHTGEVIFLGDEAVVGKDEDLAMLMENEPDRFRFIDPIQSSVGWRIMADFVEQLPLSEGSEKLVQALRGSHPFARFKNSLFDHPALREQWFAFQHKAMLDLAREWLKVEGISAELVIDP